MPATDPLPKQFSSAWIRFDRNELAGSFGDIGTDLPLIIAMIPAAGLHGSTVFMVFGVLQILTGILYGVPMPMQPLKAMAVLVITQKIPGDVLLGAGFAVATVMLFLSVTGALSWLSRMIPRCVIRGIQFGLGLSLASLALREYVPSLGTNGYILAIVCFAIVVVLWGNRRIPASLLVILFGSLYASVVTIDWSTVHLAKSVELPTLDIPAWDAIWTGFIVLALPQIPLSLSNSVFATEQTLKDLFPERAIGVQKIGITYSMANFLASLLGGIPACHGCGGLAGHYAFGARTGGSVVIYGTMYLVIGVLLGNSVDAVVAAYPRPVLGVILLFEAAMLMMLVRDMASDSKEFTVVLLVGLIALGIKQGFLVGLLMGIAIWYFWEWRERHAGSPSTTHEM